MYECEDKMVSHPDHYQSGNGIEVIDVIEAFTADLKGIKATDTGNAIKYILRWPKKEKPIQDLKKAIWYIQHLIEKLEAEKKTSDDCHWERIEVVDSYGQTQDVFTHKLKPKMTHSDGDSFTISWVEPGDLEVRSKTYSMSMFTARFYEKGE